LKTYWISSLSIFWLGGSAMLCFTNQILLFILICLDLLTIGKAWHIPSPTNLTRWPWKLIGFQVYLRTKYVPSLVKIHWRMLILECSQGCYAVKIWPGELDHWPWKSIGFQIHLKTKYVPSLVKIHWRMLDIVTLPSVRPFFRNILVNTLESTSFNGFWPNLVHT
jgi:hypothetical protein